MTSRVIRANALHRGGQSHRFWIRILNTTLQRFTQTIETGLFKSLPNSSSVSNFERINTVRKYFCQIGNSGFSNLKYKKTYALDWIAVWESLLHAALNAWMYPWGYKPRLASSFDCRKQSGKKLLWFCITTFSEWSKKTDVTTNQKLHQNQSPHTHSHAFFPALRAGYMDLLRVLLGSLDCLCLLWLVQLITWVLVSKLESEFKIGVWTPKPSPTNLEWKLFKNKFLSFKISLDFIIYPQLRLDHPNYSAYFYFKEKQVSNVYSLADS